LRVRVRVFGLVQGVGFRYFVRESALSLMLKGWVRNAEDGSVEALFEGDEDSIHRAVELCRMGPPMASVERVTVSPDSGDQLPDDFRISD